MTLFVLIIGNPNIHLDAFRLTSRLARVKLGNFLGVDDRIYFLFSLTWPFHVGNELSFLHASLLAGLTEGGGGRVGACK